jgi:hypothetical protein
VRPPNACDGQTTANGRVQPDLLPVVVVYDNADTLDFGVAYLSEDAYENPLSVLKFSGATIEAATRAQFDEFRRTQPNLVKRESYHSNIESEPELKRLGWTRLSRPFGNSCQGYMRFRIPAELRPVVRQHWPKGRPAYWRPDTHEAQRDITSRIQQIQSDRPNEAARAWGAFMELVPERTADRGLSTRTGGGFSEASRGRLFPPSIYPAADDYQSYRWPIDRAQWPSFIATKEIFVESEIDFRGGRTRGFAYCGAAVRPTAAEERLATLGPIHQKPKVLRVDGHDVVSKRPADRGWIFERDEYLLSPFDISLESTRGDT